MTQIIEKNNHIIPEKFIDSSLVSKPHYTFGTQKSSDAMHPPLPSQTDIPIEASNATYDDITQEQLNFFSASEATLCADIIKAIQKNHQTLFIPLPPYAQDMILAQRIGDYITLPNTKSVVINAAGLGATQIIAEYIKQLSLDDTDNTYHAFAHLMTDYFRHGFVLHSVIYNAQALTKQDFDYLYELASLIYEKFPKQRHKPLMRFVFIGDKHIAPILRKKNNGKCQQLTVSALSITECVNALYLYTDIDKRTELFYQTVGTNAAAIRIASAGYPALLRHLLPMPDAPSLADKKMPENYLSLIINSKIDAQYHKELTQKRFVLKRGYHVMRPRTYIRLFLAAIAVIMILYAYHLWTNMAWV